MYYVERSSDGVLFESIYEKPSSLRALNIYAFIDQSPKKGRAYYRIQSKNIVTGNMSYTKPKLVVLYGEGDQSLLIYPNPASTQVYVEILDTENPEGTIDLVDNMGRVLKTITFTKNTSRYSIDLSNLSKGVYYIKVQEADGKIKATKIVVGG
jgi:Secretion system C-terminal sorting domain